jgi:hypothetical protein
MILAEKILLLQIQQLYLFFSPASGLNIHLKQPGSPMNSETLGQTSSFYSDFYNLILPNPIDSVLLTESWREWSNDFSIYQYPDAKNLQQFLKAGIEAQLLNGKIKAGNKTFYNLIAHGEYRNRTRNHFMGC